ncbi:hypothetical protein [Millisia brevis]|uniref:hypothetical protein n=1 Tax=Millisia brevis TaxID=264148 RepID=UPI0008362086|nr:hypothetical protein [Millisia brevis]
MTSGFRDTGRAIGPGLLVAAAALLLISLGLPWSRAVGVGIDVPGSFTPGFCVSMADGTVECSGMSWTPGWTVGPYAHVVAGYGSPARVGLVLALVAILFAYRRREPLLLLGVFAGVALALVSAGVTGLGGQIVALAACLLVGLHLRRTGVVVRMRDDGSLRARIVGAGDHRT